MQVNTDGGDINVSTGSVQQSNRNTVGFKAGFKWVMGGSISTPIILKLPFARLTDKGQNTCTLMCTYIICLFKNNQHEVSRNTG